MSERLLRLRRFALRIAAAVALAPLLALAPIGGPALAAQDAAAPQAVGPGPRVPDGDQTLRLLVFALHNQRAIDLVSRVSPLLSTRGSVTLDEGANTLAVRDTPAALSRVAVALRELDRAARELVIDVQLIRALTAQISPTPPTSGFEPALLGRMRQLFRFESFILLARGRIAAREGEPVDFVMGDGYRLAFRPGTVVDDRRLKLGDFRMLRVLPGKAPQEIVRTIVNLRGDQPLILGLARDEGADNALLLAMRFEVPRPGGAPRPAAD